MNILMRRCFIRPRSLPSPSLSPSSFSPSLRSNSTVSALILPKPAASQSHHDLSSYLDYANRVGLPPTSTTYVGTHYEYTVQHTLRRLGFALTRIGGRDDSGVDLLGTWSLPSLPYPMRVIVQCKAFKGKLGPNLIRELQGAFVGAPSGWRGEGVMGILVSPKSATKGVREAMGRSQWPMGWLMLESPAGQGRVSQGRVSQLLWNRAAATIGLEGMTVTTKYGGKRDGHDQDRGLDGDCALMWKDRPVAGLPELEMGKEDGQ